MGGFFLLFLVILPLEESLVPSFWLVGEKECMKGETLGGQVGVLLYFDLFGGLDRWYLLPNCCKSTTYPKDCGQCVPSHCPYGLC